MHLILVVQELSAWNEASRMFMLLLKVTGKSQRHYITAWNWMQCHAGSNVIFGHTGKFVTIVLLTVSQTDRHKRTCAGVVL
jgi:hypothetical protein